MGRYKARSVDRNRLSKKYPYIRAPKKMSFIGEADMSIELGTIIFNNQTSNKLTFEVPFDDSNYNIAIAVRDTGSGDSANVNVYVDNGNSNASQVTVAASAPFTGEVDVMAIRIKS